MKIDAIAWASAWASVSALALGTAHAAAPAASDALLEEIVVTAEKRESDVSKTPIAISVISGEDLQKNNVLNVVQLQYLAPSLAVTQTGHGVYVSLRGVTTTDQTSKGSPGIQYRQPSFSRSNANLTYTAVSGKLQTELFVTNIENKVQATGGITAYGAGTTFPTGYKFQGYGQLSQPQFWGIRENIKF